MNIPWWGYVILAGLSWGTYVPIIFFGGSEFGGKPASRLAAIVCVGVAYLVLAIVIPGIIFLMNQQQREEVSLTANGITFASLAGVMGAVGAICVVFASKEAMSQGGEEYKGEVAALAAERDAASSDDAKAAASARLTELEGEADARRAKYRILIAPLIFSIAPIVNTLLSSFWHPKAGNWNNFKWESPTLLFWVGILLVAAGTGLVLYAKEKAEVDRAQEAKRLKAEKKDAPPANP